MKKYFYLLLLSLIALSCVDEEERGSNLKEGETVNVDLDLYLPVPSALSTRAITSKEEAKVETVKVLVFDNSGNYLADQSRDVDVADKTQTTDENGGSKLTVRVPLKITKSNVSIVVLANVVNEGTSGAPAYLTTIPAINNTDTKDTYLRKLDFSLGAGAKWNATNTDDYRRFPMWGEITKSITADLITIDLLRALARVNVMIAPEAGNFKLTSVQVQNSSEGGRIVSDYPSINSDGNVSGVLRPTLSRYGDNDNLVYKDAEIVDNTCVNQIYIPEAAASSVKGDAYDGVYLIIGGTINNVQKLYRVYITNTGKNDGELLPILRNHTYKVNVTKVGEGLNDITVTIEDWNEVSIRSPYEQNTLTVSDNLFYFNPDNANSAKLVVTTTWSEWTIVDENLKGFVIERGAGTDKNVVTITPTNLNGVSEGYFYVQSGQLKKKIVVKIDPAETSNCYIRSETGSYPLCVTVKGNGRDGMTADGVQLATIENLQLEPKKIGIIWETSAGLVTLVQPDASFATTLDVSASEFSGVINYHVDLSKSSIGGNALIGAFDANGTCIWSWHIWVVPEFADGVKNENWTGNSKPYAFIDRYIGALTNIPNVNELGNNDYSLGLLYQWGRKDPFIGANGPQNQSRRATVNYNPCGNKTYTWGVSSNKTLEETVKNPTTLLQTGLCNVEGKGTYFWGTQSGMEMYTSGQGSGAVNEGNKTIYDPCPVGYRVPPLLAYLFNNDYNYKTNYNGNNSYVPRGTSYNGQSYAYGFWVNFAKNSQPSFPWQGGYFPTNYDSNSYTWFPLAGVYDPALMSKGDNITYKFADVDNSNSLKVNSIVWTNTPIKYGKGDEAFRPGAMFLHGTEVNNSNNGRHIHRFIETSNDLYAQTQYAGSVRCVKIQASQDFSNLNEFPKEVVLDAFAGSSITKQIKVINETWEVVNPGAPWFYLDKYSGKADAGAGQNLTFIASEANPEVSQRGPATLTIRTSKGDITHDYDIKVYQTATVYEFSVSPFSSSGSPINWGSKEGTYDFTVKNEYPGSWSVFSYPDWIIPTKNGNKLTISYEANNNKRARTGIIILNNGAGKTVSVYVKQAKK